MRTRELKGKSTLEILEHRRWMKGNLSNSGWGKSMSVCMLGAKNISMTGEVYNCFDGYFDWCEKVGRIAEDLFPGRATEDSINKPWVPTFNDHPDTTLEDVKLVLKHAEAERL